jgi:putative Holliday junction resolvase
MALDVGDKTIGVAVSDELGWTAQGLEVIRRTSWGKDMIRLQELIKEYDVGRIVVGYPKNMNGSIGPRAQLAADFAERLSGETGLRVKLWDERLTTMEAERILIAADMSRAKRRKVIDKMAAVLILQNYMQASPDCPESG